MQVDLFNQSLLLAVSFATFSALAYGFLKNPSLYPMYRATKYSILFPARLVIIGATALVLSVGVRLIVQAQFPQDDIPWESAGWVLPLGVAIMLAFYTIRSWQSAIVGTVGIVCSIILALLLANNYYHYYPTLAAFLGNEQGGAISAHQALSANPTRSEIVLEDYYLSPPHQPADGELLPVSIPASGSFKPRQGRIYLPPALHGNDLLRLPVVVLLPGYPGKPVDWEQAGILAIMNSFASRHKGLAPIVAVVDPLGESGVDTECVDSKLGAAETYLAKDVPNYLKKHYQVSQDARDWTIAGYSAGGMCSTLVALRNPSVYQNFVNVSGDTHPSLKTPADTLATLFDGSQARQDAHMPDLLLKKQDPRYKTMHAWYFIGEQDNPSINKRTREQAALAKRAGITVMEKSMSGHHSFLVWKTGYVDSLPWMMNQLRLTKNEK